MRELFWAMLAGLAISLSVSACGKSSGKGKDTTNTDQPAGDTDDPTTDTDDPATDTDDDPTTDTDGGDDDTPIDTNATSPRMGAAFCAAGGRWSNGQVQGVGCLAPLDVATQPASNDQYQWKPGPTVVVGTP